MKRLVHPIIPVLVLIVVVFILIGAWYLHYGKDHKYSRPANADTVIDQPVEVVKKIEIYTLAYWPNEDLYKFVADKGNIYVCFLTEDGGSHQKAYKLFKGWRESDKWQVIKIGQGQFETNYFFAGPHKIQTPPTEKPQE